MSRVPRKLERHRGARDVSYFNFFGSQSRESAFIFSALSAVFNPPKTLVKV